MSSTSQKRIKAIVIIATLIFAFNAKAADDGNLIADPGFETQKKEWNLPPEFKFSEEGGRTGPGCVAVINENPRKTPFATLNVLICGSKVYTFSVWAKALSSRPVIKIELYNDQGGNPVGKYAWLAGGPKIGGWEKYSVSVQAPRDIVKAILLMRQMGTGESFFDDAEFFPRDLVLYDIKTDKNVVYSDDRLKFTTTFSFNTDNPDTLSGMKAVLKVTEDKTGTEVFQFGPADVDKVELPFSFSLPQDKIGVFNISSSVTDKDGKVLHEEDDFLLVLPRPSIVKKGYYEIDGKPFFPIGIYHAFSFHDAEYKILQDAGFNALQGCGGSAKKLDHALQYGLHWGQVLYRGSKIDQETYDYTRNYVNKLKGHKGLLGFWYQDEPDAANVEFRQMMKQRRIHFENSPDTASSCCMFPTYQGFQKWSQIIDVVFHDPYYKCRNPFPITMVREWVDLAKKAKKPIVTVIQAFPYPLLPTPAELENSVYQALIHGSIGIYYYSFRDSSWYLPESGIWESVKKVNGEIGTLAPVLLSDAMRRETWNAKANADVDWVIATVGNETYALAVNVTEKTAAAIIPVPTGVKGSVKALFGRGSPQISDGKIVDTIEPLGTRAYVMK